MNKQAFNEFCASVMGYVKKNGSLHKNSDTFIVVLPTLGNMFYNPHDDLNQLSEVVERLANDTIDYKHLFNMRHSDVIDKGILEFCREFVEACRND